VRRERVPRAEEPADLGKGLARGDGHGGGRRDGGTQEVQGQHGVWCVLYML
jgi:hypothetical protein